MTKKTSDIVSISEFIDLYKEYETVLRDLLGINPYTYEGRQEPPLSTKLQIIRLNRNYIQHEPDPEFVKISRDQYELLRTVIANIKRETGIAKDEMIPIRKYPHLYDDMTVTEAMTVFGESTTDRIPVISRQSSRFLGICSSMQFLKYASKVRGATKLKPQRAGKEKLELEETPTIETDSALCDIAAGTYLVTKNGKAAGVLTIS